MSSLTPTFGMGANAGVESNPTLARVADVDAAFMCPIDAATLVSVSMLQCVNNVDAPIDAAIGVN
jgi:hypothetical protein